jgi:hypothetical protein
VVLRGGRNARKLHTYNSIARARSFLARIIKRLAPGRRFFIPRQDTHRSRDLVAFSDLKLCSPRRFQKQRFVSKYRIRLQRRQSDQKIIEIKALKIHFPAVPQMEGREHPDLACTRCDRRRILCSFERLDHHSPDRDTPDSGQCLGFPEKRIGNIGSHPHASLRSN